MLRSIGKQSGESMESSWRRRGRPLWWEGVAEKEGFKPGMNEWARGDRWWRQATRIYTQRSQLYECSAAIVQYDRTKSDFWNGESDVPCRPSKGVDCPSPCLLRSAAAAFNVAVLRANGPRAPAGFLLYISTAHTRTRRCSAHSHRASLHCRRRHFRRANPTTERQHGSATVTVTRGLRGSADIARGGDQGHIADPSIIRDRS